MSVENKYQICVKALMGQQVHYILFIERVVIISNTCSIFVKS